MIKIKPSIAISLSIVLLAIIFHGCIPEPVYACPEQKVMIEKLPRAALQMPKGWVPPAPKRVKYEAPLKPKKMARR